MNRAIVKEEYLYLAAFWRPKFLAKSSGATSSRGHTRSGYITTWLYFQLWVAFLLSHSSRFLRHSVSVGATQENNSPSVCG